MIRRPREDIEDARRGLSTITEWNDRHDVVGLTPDHWISPIDFTPVGWINKGYKAYKAAKVGYRLGKRGLTTFGRAAYKEARQHAASAGISLTGKGAKRYVSSIKSSGSSSRAYQQNVSPGGTSKRSTSYRIPGSPSKFTGRFKDGHNDHWRGVTEEWIRNPCKKGYRPDKIKGRWVCRKGTWSSYKKDLKSGRL